MKVLSAERKEMMGQTEAVSGVKFKRKQLEEKRAAFNRSIERLRTGLTDFAAADIKLPTPLPDDASDLQRVVTSSSARSSVSGLDHQLRSYLGDLKQQAKSASDKLSSSQKSLASTIGQLKTTEQDTLVENEKTVCHHTTPDSIPHPLITFVCSLLVGPCSVLGRSNPVGTSFQPRASLWTRKWI